MCGVSLAVALVLCALGSSTALAGSHERPNGSVLATCSSVTYSFKNFPNANNNTVTEQVYIHGTLVKTIMFQFNGPTGSNTIPINPGPEPGIVDTKASWNTNGFRGGWDIATYLKCADPAFTLEKLQKIEGTGDPFTTAPLKAEGGQTVDYEIILTNTGNTSLTFTNFTDAKCDSGTISGGPSGPLAPGESATYTCQHVLSTTNKTTATYENTASVKGSPPKNQGSPHSVKSNTVVVTTPGTNHERPNGSLSATCESVTFTFKNFPNANNNTVTEEVFVHGKRVKTLIFSFNGPTGSNTVSITVPPGSGLIDGRAHWKTNGVKGGFDIAYNFTCPAKPAFTIEKLQKIAGSAGEFTTEPLTGEFPQTIDYEIVVKDTGNTTLTFSNFTDTKCETLAGGPSGPLAPGESATYTCEHPISLTDHAEGSYSNSATDTGTPPEGQGSPITHTSNTVVVKT